MFFAQQEVDDTDVVPVRLDGVIQTVFLPHPLGDSVHGQGEVQGPAPLDRPVGQTHRLTLAGLLADFLIEIRQEVKAFLNLYRKE